MSDLHADLKSFQRFAEMKLEQPGYESLEELLSLWRANHPLKRESAASPKRARSQPAEEKRPDPPGKSAIPYL